MNVGDVSKDGDSVSLLDGYVTTDSTLHRIVDIFQKHASNSARASKPQKPLD